MDLKAYLRGNRGIQIGDLYHNSFVRMLSEEKILKVLGVNPPYHAREFEVAVSKGGNRRCDLIVFNNELAIIEAKVIRSLDSKAKSRRIKDINSQLKADYSFFNKKRINEGIRLIGAFKMLNDDFFCFYDLPPSGLSVDCLEILQVPCL